MNYISLNSLRDTLITHIGILPARWDVAVVSRSKNQRRAVDNRRSEHTYHISNLISCIVSPHTFRNIGIYGLTVNSPLRKCPRIHKFKPKGSRVLGAGQHSGITDSSCEFSAIFVGKHRRKFTYKCQSSDRVHVLATQRPRCHQGTSEGLVPVARIHPSLAATNNPAGHHS